MAGVSVATVSYILNDRTDVSISAATRERVRAVARELDYQPNRIAQALKGNRTYTIGLWMGGLEEPFDLAVIADVERHARVAGFEVLIARVEQGAGWRGQLGRLLRWPVDGVVGFHCAVSLEAYRATRVGHSTPCVSMGAYYLSGVDHVALDLRSGARVAVRHLIDCGRRRIAYLAPARVCDLSEVRYQAYVELMQEIGQQPIVVMVHHDPADPIRISAYRAIVERVRENLDFDALFCYNDDMAIGAQRALLDAGIRIPDDVAVVGHDGMLDTAFFEPPISTVSYPLAEMCALAWRFLSARIEDSALPPQRVTLRPEFIPRRSSLCSERGRN